ncbi:c-type cytochrome [Paucibacter soli]|uniref:c-type cytochrome n=1 Tax=Paucibacter soli TaxID=3133433 RepID=UPI0030B7DD47
MRALILLPLLLAACGADQAAAPTAAQLERHRPADARLAAQYERACFNCHARAESGAPLTGHAAAWAPRLKRGMPALLSSVKNGLNSMPSMGLCPDCSDADLEQLTRYMSSPL